MTRFLLDTNAASDFVNRRYGVFDRARREVAAGNSIGIAMPVLAEMVAGIERSASRERNLASLKAALAALKLWPFDPAAAFEYGRLHAELARLGRPIGVVDTMIAAIAKTLGGCTVVTTDSDLRAVPGLNIENWRE
ncbi:MAG: type II toxin-antitoxin system VapC family toxin [Planctomycetes bacterium]|nr:type II toxin-antitoxin system VapC family toxin [Planctomycetota bacterium]